MLSHYIDLLVHLMEEETKVAPRVKKEKSLEAPSIKKRNMSAERKQLVLAAPKVPSVFQLVFPSVLKANRGDCKAASIETPGANYDGS